MSKASESSGNLRKLIGNERANKMGNYTESTGGGTPIPKGEKLKDHPEAKRVQQPRDDEGKFTYNAVNFKDLKYGPSRGETIPPFLRGVEFVYAQKNANGKIITDGSRYNVSNLDMDGGELIDNFKEYKSAEGGFKGINNARFEKGKGRWSKADKERKEDGTPGYSGNTTNLAKYDTINQYKNDYGKYKEKAKDKKQRLAKKKENKENNDDKFGVQGGEENKSQVQDTSNVENVNNDTNMSNENNGTQNVNEETNVSSDNANNDVPNNNDVPTGGENNEVPETPQENTAEKGVQENRMPTGGGDTPSGNGNIGEVNKAKDNSLGTENSNMNNDTSSNQQQGELSGAGNSQQEENNSSNGEAGAFEDIEDNPTQNEQDMSNAGDDTPSQNSAIFSKNDLEMASKNQSGFYNKYRNQIDGLVKYAEKLGFKGLNKFEIMKKIASGKYKTLKSFEDALVANYKKHNNGQAPEAYTGPGSEKIQKTISNSVVGESDKKAEGTGSKGSFKAKVDKKLAKTNKVEWVNQNRANITKLIDYCDNTLDMPDISPKRIANMAASGMFKTFEEIKEYFDDKYEIETGERPILNQFAQRNAETEKQIGKTIED